LPPNFWRISARMHCTYKMAAPRQSGDGMSDEAKIKCKLDRIYMKCHRKGDCLLVHSGCKNKYGYFRYHLRYPGHGEVNTTLHRAVFILEGRQPTLIRNTAAGEVSHRCGEKSCVEVRHLKLESSTANKKRIGCHSSEKCDGCSPPCIIIKKQL
jgi:hypothetical protein